MFASVVGRDRPVILAMSLSLVLLPALCAAIRISPDDITDATGGKPFTFTMAASGGLAPYTFSVIDGSMPPGLSLSGNTITGTPPITIYGVYYFVVEARDAAGAIGQMDYFLRVFPADITLSTTTLPAGKIGSPYTAALLANGGIGLLRFRLESGALPPGLTLTDNSIKGTPTAAGTFPFTIRISDFFRNTATFAVSITISAGDEVPLGVTPTSVPRGSVLVGYIPLTFTGTGGVGNYTLTLKGTLPEGMVFADNTLSGTPSSKSAGTYPFSIEVKDGSGAVATQQYTLNISTLTVDPSTLPAAATGVSYGPVTFTASGGDGSYTFSVTGDLPAGLAFTSPTLSGTPAADSAGTYRFSIQVKDASGGAGSTAMTLTVNTGTGGGGGGGGGGPIVIAPLSLTLPPIAGAVNEYLQVLLLAAGGKPPFTFGVSRGSLPPGMTLTTNGSFSGVPSQAGAFPVTISVQDSAGSVPATSSVTIAINGPLSLVTTALPTLVPGVPYWAPLRAADGLPPYFWIVTSGILPPGLTLNWRTGVISGITKETGGFYRFDIQLSDAGGVTASNSFLLGPDNTPLAIDSGAMPPAVYAQPYRKPVRGTGPAPLSWLLESGDLPPGLSLAADGVVSGVPRATGKFEFTVRLIDAGLRSVAQTIALQVNAPLRVKTAFPLPDALTGVGSVSFEAEGGVPPYTWSVLSGSLPPGFVLSPAGQISGKTRAEGLFQFDVAVTDSADGQSRVPYSLRVAPGLFIDSTTLPDGLSDSPYRATLAASGGARPYRWSAVGLPAELSIDPAAGVISGTPRVRQQVTCAITVVDPAGGSDTQRLKFTIETGPLVLVTKTLAGAVAGAPYRAQLEASGGVRPYSWSVIAGGLPEGLLMTPDGQITGTPATARNYSFLVALLDDAFTLLKGEVTLSVRTLPLTWEGAPAPDATVGVPYSFRFTASGGSPPYGWSIVSGSVPPGLRLAPDGTFSGVTSQAGAYAFLVAVVDDRSSVVTAEVDLRVLPVPPSNLTVTLPATVPPAAQIPVDISAGGASLPGGVTLDLKFTGEATADDPAVQFSTGGRSVTVPAIPAAVAIQTGSSAGSITVRARAASPVADAGEPAITVTQVTRAAPVVEQIEALRTEGGVELAITGYTSTREISNVTVRFEQAGSDPGSGGLVVFNGNDFRDWFASPASRPFGGQFRWRRFFPVAEADRLVRVWVGIANSAGPSQPAVANVR